MVSKICDQHYHRLNSWNQPLLAPQLYDDVMHEKGSSLESCFGFVDATIYRIARPNRNQGQVYNGDKRVHALKSWAVILPNGMIGNLTGPYEERRHDSFMLADFGLLQ